MVFGAHGMKISQNEAARRARTNRDRGTTTRELVKVLRGAGFNVRAGERQNLKTVERALDKGAMVIVCYTEPVMEWGHYSIVREISDGKVRLMDPDARTGKTSMLVDEFRSRWKDPLFTRTVRWAAIVGLPSTTQANLKQP